MRNNLGRVLGFVGAVGASAALVGASVAGTGAYFTNSEDGNLTGSFGSIDITEGDDQVALGMILPGEQKFDSVGYSNTGTSPQDVYLVLDPASRATLNNPQMGAANNTFVVKTGDTVHFESKNLATKPVPAAIQIAEDFAPGIGTRTTSVSYGVSSAVGNTQQSQTAYQGQTFNVPFKLTATQPDVAPGATGTTGTNPAA